MATINTNTAVTTKFYSLNEFKSVINSSSLQIVKNPNTGKIFAVSEDGQKFKVQQDLDMNKPIGFIHSTDESFEQGCICNMSEQNQNVMGTI